MSKITNDARDALQLYPYGKSGRQRVQLFQFELLVWFYVVRCIICQSVNCVEWWVNGLRPRVAFPSYFVVVALLPCFRFRYCISNFIRQFRQVLECCTESVH